MQDMINNLSIAEKIELYNCLYEDLAGKGIDGDTQLAHVNVETDLLGHDQFACPPCKGSTQRWHPKCCGNRLRLP